MSEQTLLAVRALVKRFGGLQALDKLSFDVYPGEILGIVGPNGAGKTALINCVTGFYAPNDGQILLGNQDITGLPVHRIGRLGIARTFQNIRLFRRMTVLENVAAVTRDWVRQPLRSVLAGRQGVIRDESMAILERLRLDSKADQVAGGLAYGEARRLEIARALATRPRLLFLDEPAAGMNEQETEALIGDIRAISKLVEGVVVVEHDIDLIRTLSTRLVAMNYGRRIAQGSAAEVFADREVIEAYLGRDNA
jgi:branched-chain amino acid transport system ATP-binding protein